MSNLEWTPEKIRKLRIKLGKTQKEFAELIGVHAGTVIRWENGTFNPSKMALKILDIVEKKEP